MIHHPPTRRQLHAIDQARLHGTLGKIDRSRQYEADPDAASPSGLLRSQDHQWIRLRRIELWLKVIGALCTVLAGLFALLRVWKPC